MAPPYIDRDPTRHQNIIAVFQMTPALLAMLHYTLSWILGFQSTHEGHGRGSSLPWVCGAFAFAGTASAAVHIGTLAGAAVWDDTLQGMYSGVSQSQVLGANVGKVGMGASLFLQYDCAIINICTVVWGYLSLRSVECRHGTALLIGLGVMNTLFGPGAMMSAVLYWREVEKEKTRTS